MGQPLSKNNFDTDSEKIEQSLAQKLRKICDKNGKELNPAKSAPILHQLGRIYHEKGQKGHDKISMIQSAGLYNAAIPRSSKNETLKQTIQEDLLNLCGLILREARANNQSSDLVEQSNKVKAAIEDMRSKVMQQLLTIISIPDSASKDELYCLEEQKIQSIRNLQAQIFNAYKQIMADLAAYCHNVMGNSPCRFALVGMGSLARKEITPYSDFENIIVLENEEWDALTGTQQEAVFEYFRWFAVIFQTVLINLKESILPSLAIPCLNDYYLGNKNDDWFYDVFTTKGVSFDSMKPIGCKSPLGRWQHTRNKPWTTELIQPVDNMLEFLSKDESLKNGYKLDDILTKTCFVYGDESVYDQFNTGVIKVQEQENQQDKLHSITAQINDDMESFATIFTLFQVDDKLDIKRVMYRSTTIFLAALGRLFNIQAQSCFDIIEKLNETNEFSDYAKHKLMFAVSLACEIRLRWYTRNQSQTDDITSTKQVTATKILTNLIGKSSLISYFQTTYALQCDISKRLQLKRLHFHANPTLFNLSLVHCLIDNMKTIPRISNKQISTEITDRLFSFDQCLAQLESDDNVKSISSDQGLQKLSDEDRFAYYRKMGDHLRDTNCFDAAIEFYLKSLDNILGHVKQTAQNTNIHKLAILRLNDLSKNKKLKVLRHNNQSRSGYTLHNIGYCLLQLYKPHEALQYYNRALQIKEKTSSDVDTDRDLAKTLHEKGRCLLDLNKPHEALQYYNRALQIKEKTSSDVDTDRNVATTLHEKGRCLMNWNKSHEALQYYDRALQIYEKTSFDVDTDRDLANTLHEKGTCLLDLNKPHEALQYYNRALQIDEKTSFDVDTDRKLAITLHEKGTCLLKSNKPHEALQYYDRALQIKEKTSSDVDTDRDLATTLHEKGTCLLNLNKPHEALQYYNRVLQIYEKTSFDVDTDRDLAHTLHEKACCLLDLNKSHEALLYYNRALQIKEKTSSDVDTDRNLAITLHSKGCCLLKSNKSHEALQYHNRALQIKEKTSSDVDTDRNIAHTLHEKARCLLNLNKPHEALQYYNRALQIKEKTSSDVDTDRNLAITLHSKGCCLLKSNKSHEALQYHNRALQIKEKTSSDVDTDRNIAHTLHEKARCLLDLNKPHEALQYYNRALQIKEKTSSVVDTDRSLAITLHEKARCLLDLNKPHDALQYFNRAVQIYEKTSSDVDTDRDLANTLHGIGRSLSILHKLDDALLYFENSLKILEKMTFDTGIISDTRNVAKNCDLIALCLLKRNKTTKALPYINKSISICRDTDVDVHSDLNFADSLHEIHVFLLNLNKLEEANRYLNRSQSIRQRSS